MRHIDVKENFLTFDIVIATMMGENIFQISIIQTAIKVKGRAIFENFKDAQLVSNNKNLDGKDIGEIVEKTSGIYLN